MITEQQALDDLIVAAAQENNDAAVIKLLSEIKTCDVKLLKDAAANFDFLFEAWDDTVAKFDDKAAVCLYLAENSVLDTQNFRTALHNAVRKFLPPYISSPGIAKTVGARDQSVPVHDVAARIRKLRKLKTNAFVYQIESQSWGRVVNVDKVVATIAVNTFATGAQLSIPIANALAGCLFFEPSVEMTSIIATEKRNLKPAAFYHQKLEKYSLGDLSETKIKDVLFRMFVPQILSQEEFAKWWASADAPAAAAPRQRAFQDARSILELSTLLAPLDPAAVKVDMAAAQKLSKLFLHLKPVMSPKDLEMLAECIAMLADSADAETLKVMYQPLRGKVAFWPREINESIPLKQLEIWGRLSVRHFTGFLKAASLVYDRLEIAKLATILPLRCISIMFESLTVDDISDAVFAANSLNSDILLAIWKNRAKFPHELTSFLTMANISAALSVEGLPKEWAAAQRELKKSLFDKADFQKFVLANAGSNIPSVITAIQRMRNMAPGECQSLLVKLSRHSEALKEQIESGEGRKLLAAQDAEAGKKPKEGPPMTSIRSYKGLVAELDNIVKVQVPENNKAIEHARGFGDFRENAEYDAAKERRRFLQRRRSELEMLIATVQPIDFRAIRIDPEKVSFGTMVTAESPDGKTTDYCIVGAWDGDPDRNLVSYKTKFGETLLGAKVGETVKLPDGETITIKKISPLPDALAKELSPEE